MSELKERKNKAEDLNRRIADCMNSKKTRQRTNDKKHGKKSVGNLPDDLLNEEFEKEKILRDLFQESKILNIQSEQISKL